MIVEKWHDYLQMPKHDLAWHEQDLSDELREYRQADNWLHKWSEASDVVYTCTRGRWSGHDIIFPLSRRAYLLGQLYMLPKYTLRFWFFKQAGQRAGANKVVREVRNPAKTHKLHTIAQKYGLDEATFQQICEHQLKRRILLP